jgi:hypothetical protein
VPRQYAALFPRLGKELQRKLFISEKIFSKIKVPTIMMTCDHYEQRTCQELWMVFFLQRKTQNHNLSQI